MRPQLGHYRVEISDPSPGVVSVVPGNQEPAILLWINRETSIVAVLNSSQARKIAQGLLICAERLDYPNAVAGPEAWR